MKLYKVSADGTKTEVTDKEPSIKTTDGQQTFTYDKLDKLEKGEKYIVEYSANVKKARLKQMDHLKSKIMFMHIHLITMLIDGLVQLLKFLRQ